MDSSNNESCDSYVISDSEEEDITEIHGEDKGSNAVIIIDSTDTSGTTTPAENLSKGKLLLTEEDIKRRIKEQIPSFSDEDNTDDEIDNKSKRFASDSSVSGGSSESDNSSLVDAHMSEAHEDNALHTVKAFLKKETIKYRDYEEDSDSMESSITINSIEENDNNSRADYDILSVSLAQEEVGDNNIDPVTAQKRAFLACRKERLQKDLRDAKLLLSASNIDLLPDKGEKVRRCIAEQEKELEDVMTELKNTPLVRLRSNSHTPNSHTSNSLGAKIFGKTSISTEESEKDMEALESINDRLQDLHGSLETRPSEDEKARDPVGLIVKLMPHQQHALAWLLWREQQRPSGGILADDMGLGKTLTMISLIIASNAKNLDEWKDDYQRTDRPVRHKGGTLVVCPASLLDQWENEIRNRCKRDTLKVTIHHGTKRATAAKILSRNDVVITTYNILAREHGNGTTFLIDWERIILDEAHIIRNHKTKASEAVCDISARKRWALTGTPIHNKMMDLYSIMKFLKCSPFDNIRVWKRWVEKKDAISNQRLGTVMRSLMLRRTKDELQAKGEMKSLPQKSLEEISVTLDLPEQLVYKKVLIYSRTLFAQFLAQRSERAGMDYWSSKQHKNIKFTRTENLLLSAHADVKTHEILVLLLRLRQICVHPWLINSMLDEEDMQAGGMADADNLDPRLLSQINKINLHDSVEMADIEDETVVDQRLAANLLTSANPVFNADRLSSKMRMVFDKIQEILQKGDKIVVVSQWTSTLELIASKLDVIKGATYSMFTGKLKIKDRQGVVDSFNQPTNDPKILLLSLTAGGVGLNLIGGNHLLLVDIHWNPQLEVQAQDRVYRYGQTKDVHIYKFICKDTIEENIKSLQESKLQLAQNALTGDKTIASKLTLTDLKTIFGL
ncbi:transcription termination factor 2 [Ceratina calcarata]|uniref:Transcription termination factor 2 n=1 Tax=Ceratina calcarata TaxID=156304 RepID=A0AAJ7J7Y0_9HYME|nr:transcription termination factor 2 [Ceratina calcarata]